MILQVVMIFSLALAALLSVVALLIYRRKGMSTKRWYRVMGVYIFALLCFALVGFLGRFSQVDAGMVVVCGALSIFEAWRWHPQTR